MVTDRGGIGAPLLLVMDQRGHGRSTRRPWDFSRGAYVADVVPVIEKMLPGQRCVLVGQPMGARTAFLSAAARPDLVERLVMLEGQVAGSTDPDDAAGLGRYFASWRVPFADQNLDPSGAGRRYADAVTWLQKYARS